MLRERQIEPVDEVRKRAVEVLVRKVPDDQQVSILWGEGGGRVQLLVL